MRITAGSPDKRPICIDEDGLLLRGRDRFAEDHGVIRVGAPSGEGAARRPRERRADLTRDRRQRAAVFIAPESRQAVEQAQNALLNNNALFVGNAMKEDYWKSDAVPEGLIPGLSRENRTDADVLGAVCTIANNFYVLTWLDEKDEDGNFAYRPLPLGETKIMNALRSVVSRENLGQAAEGGLIFTQEGGFALMGGCRDLEIPDGSPVILTRLNPPKNKNVSVSYKEYRTEQCPAGEQGTIRLQRQVTRERNSLKPSYSAWETQSYSCISKPSPVVASITRQQVANGATDPDSTTLRNLLLNALHSGSCTDVGVEGRKDGKNTTSELLSTCGTSRVSLSAPPRLASQVETVVASDARQIQCGGEFGEFTDSLGGFEGIVRHTPWMGTAEFTRSSSRITSSEADSKDDEEYADQVEKSFILRSVWMGNHLFCARNETLTIACSTLKPSLPGLKAIDGNVDYSFNRTATVSGFKNASSFMPGDPLRSDWVKVSGNCQWTQTEETTDFCADASRVPTVQSRVVTASPEGTVAGDWTLTPGNCNGTATITEPGNTHAPQVTAASVETTTVEVQEVQCLSGTTLTPGERKRTHAFVDGQEISVSGWSTTSDPICDEPVETFTVETEEMQCLSGTTVSPGEKMRTRTFLEGLEISVSEWNVTSNPVCDEDDPVSPTSELETASIPCADGQAGTPGSKQRYVTKLNGQFVSATDWTTTTAPSCNDVPPAQVCPAPFQRAADGGCYYLTTEERSVACPAGQQGSISERQTVTVHYPGIRDGWGNWSPVSNTCKRISTCPGQITFDEVYNRLPVPTSGYAAETATMNAICHALDCAGGFAGMDRAIPIYHDYGCYADGESSVCDVRFEGYAWTPTDIENRFEMDGFRSPEDNRLTSWRNNTWLSISGRDVSGDYSRGRHIAKVTAHLKRLTCNAE